MTRHKGFQDFKTKSKVSAAYSVENSVGYIEYLCV